ncbi:MAG: DUF3306 domain-containing protein [Alphaproteobacteria bacterium]|nr:DUF3306 domain-containing protein [Alphaproteobacteria bacterium]
MAEQEGRLQRWARRKAAVGTETELAEGVSVDAAPEIAPGALREADPPAAPPETPEEIPPEDLPDVESLDKDSDYTVFLRENVPQALRNMALRKLWLSDPVFANLDGLVDYGEDFTDAATVIAGMKSAYQVGKGYITEEDERAAAEAEAEAEDAAETAADAKDPEAAEQDSDGDADRADAEAETEESEPGKDREAPAPEAEAATDDSGVAPSDDELTVEQAGSQTSRAFARADKRE